MPAPVIDLSRQPLFVVTFDGVSTDAEFRAYLDETTRIMITRKSPTVTIVDSRGSSRVPPSQRKMQADWINQYSNLLAKWSLGTAFVIDSPLVRGALTAIFWLQRLPMEYVVVGTRAEAERWAAERLRSVGLELPPRAERAQSS